MELAELRAFVAVVQDGSFTRAAERLGSQKSTISRTVSALERKLGVRLLERTTRALHLTEVGREVHARAVGILGALEDTALAARRQQAEPSGTLRITCGSDFGQIAVNGWIHRFMARYPHVVVEADYTGRVVDLVHEGIDLAIRIGALPDSTLAARRLGALDYGLFASPDYLARCSVPDRAGALQRHALLCFHAGAHRSGWRLRQGDEEVLVDDGGARLRANQSVAVRDAAVAGLGIALLPRLLAGPAEESGRLRRVLSDWQLPSYPVHAVFPSNRYLSANVRAFVDLAVEAFTADAQSSVSSTGA